MESGTIVDRIISKECLVPYLQHNVNEILDGIEWLDKGILDWIGELNHVDQTIERYRNTIK